MYKILCHHEDIFLTCTNIYNLRLGVKLFTNVLIIDKPPREVGGKLMSLLLLLLLL